MANGLVIVAQYVLFLLPLGLIFGLLGYVPDHLRLLLIYLLLLEPILLARTRRRAELLLLLLALAAGVVLNGVVTHNPLFQIASLLLLHFLVWSRADSRWLKLYPAVIAFLFLYVALFLSPLGFYPVEALVGRLSALFTSLLRAPCSLGFTYQNTGSMLLFLVLSVSLIRSRLSLVRTLCFAVVLVLLTTLLFKLVLYRLDLNPELMLKLGVYEYTGNREYISFYSRIAVLLFPGLLFLAHLGLFGIYHFRDACGDTPEADGAS